MSSATRPALLGSGELAIARKTANRIRAEWLVAITTGAATVDDLLRAAAEPDGKPLLRISLRQLLLAQPGVGTQGAKKLLRKTHVAAFGHDESKWTALRTVANLLDTRAEGSRYLSLRDALATRRTPSRGFPFTPIEHQDTPTLTQSGARGRTS